VLAALGEVGSSIEIDASVLAGLVEDAGLEDLRLLLEAAYVAAPELAVAMVERLGGSNKLLSRLQNERPWVRMARLVTDDDGRSIAEAQYVYVAESHQPNVHDAVVELARYLAAFAPAAEVAACRAVDALGDTAQRAGNPVADKAIDRRNLPSPAEIAWNRARTRAALAAVAAPTKTAYSVSAREIVMQAAQLMRGVAEVWCSASRRMSSWSAMASRLTGRPRS
jgi:hypothetical protein